VQPMARRRRGASNGGLALVAGAVAGVLWLWGQPWGPSLLIVLGVVAVAAGMVRITTATRRRRQRLHRLATLHGLLELTPAEFEDEVAELLRALGFADVHVSAGAGDLQADIVATDPDGLATIVQCKRYAPGRTIGSPVIQSFIGMARIHHGCERALFVTTGSFTQPAYRLADEHDIELIDGAELVDLFTQRARLVWAD
jgi:restriction system protein